VDLGVKLRKLLLVLDMISVVFVAGYPINTMLSSGLLLPKMLRVVSLFFVSFMSSLML
jgi:hypothetical protein